MGGLRNGYAGTVGGYGPGRGIARPRDGYAGDRFGATSNRGFQTQGQSFLRPTAEAYDRMPASTSRTQQSSRQQSRLAYGPRLTEEVSAVRNGASAVRCR